MVSHTKLQITVNAHCAFFHSLITGQRSCVKLHKSDVTVSKFVNVHMYKRTGDTGIYKLFTSI